MNLTLRQPTEHDSWRDTEMALDHVTTGAGIMPADPQAPWPPRARVAPIKLPDPELVNRACAARQRIERDVDAARVERELRQHHAIDAAHFNGRELGERVGYTQGWHWGLSCGVVLGGLGVVGIAFCIVLLRTHGFT